VNEVTRRKFKNKKAFEISTKHDKKLEVTEKETKKPEQVTA